MQSHHKTVLLSGVAFYLVVELASYLRFRRKVNNVKNQVIPMPSPKFRLDVWQKWFEAEMRQQIHPKDILEGVFQAPLHRICRERALHWMCWHMTMRELESYEDNRYPREIVELCEDILSVMEDKGRFALHSNPLMTWLPLSTPTESTHGDNAGVVDFVRIGRGGINAFYKPLLVQGITTLARMYAEGELRGMGFIRVVDEFNIAYWIRLPQQVTSGFKAVDSGVRPLFFMHGMGFGAVPYIHFIRGLVDDRRAMVVPEWANISLGWADNQRPEGLTPDLYADSVAQIVSTLQNSDGSQATNIDVIGHSFVSAF